MSADNLHYLELRARQAEDDLSNLKIQLLDLKKLIVKKRLQAEHENLKAEVTKLVYNLNQLEEMNELQLNGSNNLKIVPKEPNLLKPDYTASKHNNDEIKGNSVPEPNKLNKKSSTKKKKDENTTNVVQVEEAPIDVGRLDLRIGKIMNIKKHPEADSLYIEEIDVGEGKLRTVVSGLVKHVTLDNMQEKLVIVLCNLKPAKMRGVMSEAMVMCASTPEKVELLVPPPTSKPGDLVYVDGYPRRPDIVMNPKKKIFETVAPDLKTNTQRIATYKNVPLCVTDKGNIVAPTLAEVQIK